MATLRNSVIAAATVVAAARGATVPDLADALSAVRGAPTELGRGTPLSAVHWQDATDENLEQLLTEAIPAP